MIGSLKSASRGILQGAGPLARADARVRQAGRRLRVFDRRETRGKRRSTRIVDFFSFSAISTVAFFLLDATPNTMSSATLSNSFHPTRYQPERVTPLFKCPRCRQWLAYSVTRPRSISTLVCTEGCGTFRYHHQRQLLRSDNRD